MKILLIDSPSYAVLALAKLKIKARNFLYSEDAQTLSSFELDEIELKSMANSSFTKYLVDAEGNRELVAKLESLNFTLVDNTWLYAPPTVPEDEEFFALVRVKNSGKYLHQKLTFTEVDYLLHNLADFDGLGSEVEKFFVFGLSVEVADSLDLRKTTLSGVPCYTLQPNQ